jgi:hypothetical protein
MPALSININDLPYDDKTIKVNNINDLTGQVIQTCFFHEFIVLLENKLTYVCDMIIKLALFKIDTKYAIVGGKALNNIISKNNLKNSFNYDICVKDAADSVAISNKMLSKLILNDHWQKHYRRHIFNILFHSNLVDKPNVNDITTVGTILHHYMTDQLIYSGKKISKGDKQVGTLGIPTDGLFIKLVLKKELFTKNGLRYICSNQRSEPLDNYIISPSPLNTPLPGEYNIIYLPIANIINGEGKFGDITEFLYTNTFDGLNYAKYPLLVYNLIQNIINNNKINNFRIYNKNVDKLKLLINMVLYNCQFLGDVTKTELLNQVEEFAEILEKIVNPPDNVIPDNVYLNNLKLRVFNLLIFTKDTKLINIITKFLTAYIQIYDQRKAICKKNLLLNFQAPTFFHVAQPIDNTQDFNTQIVTNVGNPDLIYNELIKLFEGQGVPQDPRLDNIDGRKYIKEYTDEYTYKIINQYCNYISVGLDSNDIDDSSFKNVNTHKEIWEGITPGPNSIISKETIENVCQGMDKVFDNVHAQYNAKNLYPLINDTFTVYSFLELIALKSPDYSLEIDYVKNGDIIQIAQYISSSYARNFDYRYFARKDRTLFKININKINNNWLFLGKYSYTPDEKEILIRRNSHFVVTDVTFETISMNNNEIEFRTISVDLCTDFQNALEKSQQIITKPFRVTDDILFRTAAKYVYDNHISNQYKDTPDQLQHSIQRYMHALANSLRMASYIMLIHAYRCNRNNAQEFPTHKYNDLTYNDILKLCITVMFITSGIESEVVWGDKLYMDYVTTSANNFENFALDLDPLLFTREEITEHMNLIKMYKLKSKHLYKAWLMHFAHELDMIRINIVGDFNDLRAEQCLGSYHFTNIINKSEQILIDTGEHKFQSTLHTLPETSYNPGVFYKSNTDINYCLNMINKTLYQDVNIPIIAPVLREQQGSGGPGLQQSPPLITFPTMKITYLNSIDIDNLQFSYKEPSKILQLDKSDKYKEYFDTITSFMKTKTGSVNDILSDYKQIEALKKIILKDTDILQNIEKNIKIFSNTISSNSTEINPFIKEYEQISINIKNNQTLLNKIYIEYYKKNNDLEKNFNKSITNKSITNKSTFTSLPTSRTGGNTMFTIRNTPAAFIIDPQNKRDIDRKLLSKYNYKIYNTGLGIVVNTNTNTNTNTHECKCCCDNVSLSIKRINTYMDYMDLLEKHNNKLIDTKLLKYNQENTRYNQEHTQYNQEHTRYNQEHTQYNQEHTRYNQEHTRYNQENTQYNQKNSDNDNYKKYMKYKNKYLQLKYL